MGYPNSYNQGTPKKPLVSLFESSKYNENGCNKFYLIVVHKQLKLCAFENILMIHFKLKN
jgi:hypothetical protein